MISGTGNREQFPQEIHNSNGDINNYVIGATLGGIGHFNLTEPVYVVLRLVSIYSVLYNYTFVI